MTDAAKVDLASYLQRGREDLLWKLDGASEYDARRPLTPTGTNLLGLVKHVASVEAGYLGDVFGRPFPEPLPWLDDDAEPNADLWATAEHSREQIVALYHRVWAHSDATIEALGLDATGTVPWWPEERRHPTLHRVLVHVIAETQRHVGHADLVRELADGAVGMRQLNDNLAQTDWPAYVRRLQEIADRFRGEPRETPRGCPGVGPGRMRGTQSDEGVPHEADPHRRDGRPGEGRVRPGPQAGEPAEDQGPDGPVQQPVEGPPDPLISPR
jgi:uncharacterized damage-inducible protein DinB